MLDQHLKLLLNQNISASSFHPQRALQTFGLVNFSESAATLFSFTLKAQADVSASKNYLYDV